MIPYSASHHLEDHPWGPTVVDADAADGEIHVDTLNLQKAGPVSSLAQGLIHHHNDAHQDLIARNNMMTIHLGRILTTGRELSHMSNEAAEIIVSTGTKVVLRQSKDGTRPYRVSFDAAPTARWNTLVSNADGAVVGAYSARSVVGTETCDKNSSLTGRSACNGFGGPCPLKSGVDSNDASNPDPLRAWSWTHRYPAIARPITRAALRMDCGDCDGGAITLRSVVDGVSAVVLGNITGGDHTPEDEAGADFQTGHGWACPNAWCQNGEAGSVACNGKGSDNTLELPASVFEDLRDGNFEIEISSVTSGTDFWASNRAILEISTDMEHLSAETGVVSRSATFLTQLLLSHELTRTSTQVSGSTHELAGDITVEAGSTLVTPPILEIPDGRTLTLGGHLMGAQHIIVRGEGAKLILKTTASSHCVARKLLNFMEVGQFHWQTLTVSGGGQLETQDVAQTIVARSISLAASENTGRTSQITARHTLVLRGHHIEIGAEGKDKRQGPRVPTPIGTWSSESSVENCWE